MKLKLTTAGALKFEEQTGKDLLLTLKEVHETGSTKLSDVIRLFCLMGEGNTPETFDAWEVPFVEKLKEVFEAVAEYFGSNKKN